MAKTDDSKQSNLKQKITDTVKQKSVESNESGGDTDSNINGVENGGSPTKPAKRDNTPETYNSQKYTKAKGWQFNEKGEPICYCLEDGTNYYPGGKCHINYSCKC